MKGKLLSGTLAVVLALALCPAVALAAPEKDAALSVGVVVQSVASDRAVEEAIKACEAIPSASKMKLSDNKTIKKAMKALANDAIDASSLSEEQVLSLNDAFETLRTASETMDGLITKATEETNAKKAPKPKAVAGKKQVTLTWKKMGGGKFTYTVYYSKKKSSGYKKALTTSNTKATVKSLKPGTKYFFKLKATRTDIPWTAGSDSTKTVSTKQGPVVKTTTQKATKSHKG